MLILSLPVASGLCTLDTGVGTLSSPTTLALNTVLSSSLSFNLLSLILSTFFARNVLVASALFRRLTTVLACAFMVAFRRASFAS